MSLIATEPMHVAILTPSTYIFWAMGFINFDYDNDCFINTRMLEGAHLWDKESKRNIARSTTNQTEESTDDLTSTTSTKHDMTLF